MAGAGPFGFDVPGEYGDEELSTTDIEINPIGSNTIVRNPIVEDADVQVPFRASATQVFALTLESNAMRLGQEAVEVVIAPTSQTMILGQMAVEIVVEQVTFIPQIWHVMN